MRPLKLKRDRFGRLILPPKREGHTLISHDIVYNRNGTVKSRATVWLKNDQKPLEVEE